MKSLSDLNRKWWYRLLKVLYCGIFLIIALVSALAVFALNETYQAPDYLITCSYGNHDMFNALHDKGISIANYDPDKEIPASMNTQILSACGITQTDIDQATANAKAKAIQQYNKNNCATSNPTGFLAEFLCPDLSAPYQTFTMYGIINSTVPVHTYGDATGYAILDLLIVLAVFEIVRRAFYYIALGRIRPPK